MEVRFDEQAQWLLMRRGAIIVAFNLGGAEAALDVSAGGHLLLASGEGVRVEGSKLFLPPSAVAVTWDNKLL